MTRAPTPRIRLCGFLVAALVSVGGCEVLVPSDLPSYTCNGNDPSACPAGQYCVNSACVQCDPQLCGDGGPPSDALDVTTDSTLSDAPPTDTPADSTGLPESASDVSADISMDVPNPPDTGCGGALGCPCASPIDCTSHICGVAAVLSPGFVTANGALCTQTCCTSADCPGGFVCYAAGTGGSYCVGATLLGRPSTLGGAGPGASCVMPTDCRSGNCSASQCEDTCCSDTNCASPAVCSLTASINGHTSFVCVNHTGSAYGASCTVGSSCASGDCSVMSCRPRCCGRPSALTLNYHACELDSVSTDLFDYGTYPGSDATGVAFGQHCTRNTDCLTRNCNLATMTCSDLCCVDSDCSTYGSYVCRPAPQPASPWTTQYLLCVTGP